MKKIFAIAIAVLMIIPALSLVTGAAEVVGEPIVLDLMNDSEIGVVADKGDEIRVSKSKVGDVDCTKFGYGVYGGPWDPPKKCLSNYYSVFYLKKGTFEKFGGAATKHVYVSVVFMTKDTEAHPIKLYASNNWKGTVLVEDASQSKGQFVRSDVFDISTSYAFKDRLAVGKAAAIDYGSKDENTEFYIKEISFFESPEAANKYYGNKYPVVESKKIEVKNEIKIDLSNADALKNSHTQITFDSGDEFHGEFVNEEKGGAMKLNYGIYGGKFAAPAGILPNYYTILKTTDEAFDASKYNFMVVVFKTATDADVPLMLYNSANWNGISLVDSAKEAKGQYVRSAAIDVRDFGIYDRISGGLPYCIAYSSEEENTEIYLKELVFFKSAEDADAYYKDTYKVLKNEEVAPPPPPPSENVETERPEETEVTTVPATSEKVETTVATEEKKGCGSVISPAVALVIGTCATGAVLTRKKRK